MVAEGQLLDQLTREYDLGGPRSLETHYYLVQSQLDILSGKGVVKKCDTFREYMKCEPGDPAAAEPDTFTCAKFVVKHGDAPEVTIPSLAGFTYTVDRRQLDAHKYDERGQFYSLPESKFKGLVDSSGAKVAFDDAYQIYSSFFYYHSHVEYAEPDADGPGVQDLKRVGDRIVHGTSHTKQPLPGSLAGAGSYWNNGEITLGFKGLAELDGAPCAILGLACKPSPWYMPINYMRIFGLKTYGLSSYVADVYLDLQTRWVRKFEMVLSEMTLVKMWGLIPVDRSYPRTSLTIREMSREEFERHVA